MITRLARATFTKLLINCCLLFLPNRPIGGVINFCYNSFDLDTYDGSVPQAKVIRDMIDTAIHEIGHILGLRSRDMVYYYDRYTGKPR